MRGYKFLDKQFGLKSLYERRLKIARIHELNDPFELIPFDLSNPAERWAFLNTRKVMSEQHGLVCFSAKWTDPVIWAHYSDKHRGLCLGFELLGDITKRVEYIEKPLHFPSNLAELPMEEQKAVSDAMLYKKFKHWEYEQEIRTFTGLTDEEDGFFYVDFGPTMALVEVVLGANCTIPRFAIERAINDLSGITIRKVRPSDNGFHMDDSP
jgi:hypothetical protein